MKIFFLRVLFLLFLPNNVQAAYDLKTLEKLGITEKHLENIKNSRIKKGKQEIAVYINGLTIGIVELDFFGEKNNFKITKDISKKFGIREPKEENGFLEEYKLSMIVYDEGVLRITIPKYYFKNQETIVKQSGKAIFSNYDINYANRSDQNESNYNVILENGINYNGFLYRNQMSIDKEDFDFSYNYISKVDYENKFKYKIGNIETQNPTYSSSNILGFQISKYNINDFKKITVNGYVDTDATIEIFQGSNKIYETRVNNGYYEIDDLFISTSNNDLTIKETQINGIINERAFLPESEELFFGENFDYGLTFGKTEEKKISTISGYADLYRKNNTLLKSGLFYQKKYQNLGLDLNNKNDFFSNIHLKLNLSNTEKETGYFTYLSMSKKIMNSNVSLYSSLRSKDYKTDMQLDTDTNKIETFGLNISLPIKYFNYASLNYRYNKREDLGKEEIYNINLSKNYSNFNVNLNISKTEYENRALLSLNIPMSSIVSSFNSSIEYRSENNTKYKIGTSGLIEDYDTSYYIDVAKTKSVTEGSIGLDTDLEEIFIQGNLYTNNNYTNTNVKARGALLYSEKGFVSSKNKVGETFAIIEVKDKENIKFKTPNGIIKTNEEGLALASNLPANIEFDVYVETKSLPSQTNIKNPIKKVKLPVGQVEYINFDTEKFYKQVLKIKNKNGDFIKRGSSVKNKEGKVVAIVSSSGMIYLKNMKENEFYFVENNEIICKFKIEKTKFEIKEKLKQIICE
tara:strand:+ start:2722 stop:4956 length:2235 start_codon:yes stop_codon:yes gene_type:complete